MTRFLAAALLAGSIGPLFAVAPASAFHDPSGAGACNVGASVMRRDGIGCDYHSCTDRGYYRGVKHLKEGESTYEVGSYVKLVCRSGQLVKAPI